MQDVGKATANIHSHPHSPTDQNLPPPQRACQLLSTARGPVFLVWVQVLVEAWRQSAGTDSGITAGSRRRRRSV